MPHKHIENLSDRIAAFVIAVLKELLGGH